MLLMTILFYSINIISNEEMTVHFALRDAGSRVSRTRNSRFLNALVYNKVTPFRE